jgi:NAD(P)-dependent dehydrogenase (short-subunit alcohol dehydrogenase family)
MFSRLYGKVCVMTGTGGSIGRASALAFAREGASVAACDLIVDAADATLELVRAQGGEMVSMQPCHLAEPADSQAMVEIALTTFPRIDVPAGSASGSRYAAFLMGELDSERKSA